MLINTTTVFSASVSQDSQHWQLMILEERQNLVTQHICCRDWCFCRVELCERYFAVGINERLLIDTPNTFKVANIECVLRAWVCCFYLTTSFIIMLRVLEQRLALPLE